MFNNYHDVSGFLTKCKKYVLSTHVKFLEGRKRGSLAQGARELARLPCFSNTCHIHQTTKEYKHEFLSEILICQQFYCRHYTCFQIKYLKNDNMYKTIKHD